MTRILLITLLFGFMLPVQAQSCFGPKLFLGLGDDAESQMLGALVMVYVKEKTGVETLAVSLEEMEEKGGFDEEHADMVLTRQQGLPGRVIMALPGAPALLVGKRPVDDLQFSTVLPALKKLSGLLTAERFAQMLEKRSPDLSPAAAARRFLTENRWI